MKATVLLEYYRQFGFVSSVLGGFAFTFFGVLLPVSPKGRAAALAAYLAVAGLDSFFSRNARHDLRRFSRGQFADGSCDAAFNCGTTDAAIVLLHRRHEPLTHEFRGGRLDTFAFYGYCHHHSSGGRSIGNISCADSFPALTA